MFVNPLGGTMIALSHVVIAKQKNSDTMSLTFSDGKQETVKLSEYHDALRNTAQHLVPAQAGTYVLHAQVDEDFIVYRQPVVAWALAADGLVYVVTADGVNEGGAEDPEVLHPDGQVISTNCHFRSFEEWEVSKRAELMPPK